MAQHVVSGSNHHSILRVNNFQLSPFNIQHYARPVLLRLIVSNGKHWSPKGIEIHRRRCICVKCRLFSSRLLFPTHLSVDTSFIPTSRPIWSPRPRSHQYRVVFIVVPVRPSVDNRLPPCVVWMKYCNGPAKRIVLDKITDTKLAISDEFVSFVKEGFIDLHRISFVVEDFPPACIPAADSVMFVLYLMSETVKIGKVDLRRVLCAGTCYHRRPEGLLLKVADDSSRGFSKKVDFMRLVVKFLNFRVRQNFDVFQSVAAPQNCCCSKLSQFIKSKRRSIPIRTCNLARRHNPVVELRRRDIADCILRYNRHQVMGVSYRRTISKWVCIPTNIEKVILSFRQFFFWRTTSR